MQAALRYFGLTGGIASGKSTVARMFAELGARVIDSDRLGHQLMRRSQPAYEALVRRFGTEILDTTGEINRQRLGALAFADPATLRELNAILHPRILDRIGDLVKDHQAQDPKAVIIVEAALIYEADVAGRFAKTIVTWCRPEQQVERLMAKAGLSREDAERRVTSQMPGEEKRRRADYLIDCSGSLQGTYLQVQAVFQELRQIVESQ